MEWNALIREGGDEENLGRRMRTKIQHWKAVQGAQAQNQHHDIATEKEKERYRELGKSLLSRAPGVTKRRPIRE